MRIIHKKSINIVFVSLLIFSMMLVVSGIATAKESSDTINVEEAIANNSGDATVEGYIVGYAYSKGNVVRKGFGGNTNVVLADDPGETDTNKMLFVKVEDQHRDKWGLKSNPDLLDEKVIVGGSLDEYFGTHGLKEVSQIEFAADTQPPEEEAPVPDVDKVYNLSDFNTDKLVLSSDSVYASIGGNSKIENGIKVMGSHAILEGRALADLTVEIKPEEIGAMVDLNGETVKKVVVRKTNLDAIHGAENIQEIEYTKGAVPEEIELTDSSGSPIGDPGSNQSPIVKEPIQNHSITVGETLNIQLSEHFSDPDGDSLTYTSEKGVVDGDTLTLDLDEGSHIVAVAASDGESDVTETFSVDVSAESPPLEDYYKAADNKEGDALKEALHNIIKDQETLSYDEVWGALKETDEAPDSSGDVRLLYSGEARSKSKNGGYVGDWNREHVWAKSHGNFGTSRGPGTDIHHLRPTDVQVNSSRGNLDFDNGGQKDIGKCDECKRSSNSFEAPDEVKGDVARMLFYMAVRYEGNDNVDLELNDQLNNGSNPFHGKLSTLLEWHKQDPVDEYEKQRNDKIYDIQGNRNPFIDHPEWAKLFKAN